MVADDKGEDRLRAVSFAAGTAAFMACIERAVMVSVFVHWRVWAFLALNLLLLAILFTSNKSQIPFNQNPCKNGADADFKNSKNKRRHCNKLVSTSAAATTKPGSCVENAPPPEPGIGVEREMESAEIEGKLEDYDQLSEEELKQRVEDFIAMFRQHLICDAKGVCANTITSRLY
ncbi:hypothetical protein C2S52_022926 [Perilla frutescens var. hirtella]|uniref:Uncharacterized protein n=1 Tax=Perilla frutescens var. hirtella TaxID=608512 RepID=A0AAD4P916_PERFH|nr:hypothetical protein C2S52_022926 [Perilla frutescens var. hirtella]KAH6774478.1 hypothetical protein C2S51_012882 [Perilla frutescens var. frutescens]KAH6830262.1 hypothetical protein C2S53_000231 [Perilla frutescens var. hirtella]